MRMSRRAVLHGAGSGKRVTFSYSGAHDLFGDNLKGFAVLKGNGTLTIKGTVDLCVVGGGGKGEDALSGPAKAGGAGGYVENYLAQALHGSFSVTIGAGSTSTSTGEQTTVGITYAANGGTSSTTNTSVSGRGTSGKGATTTASAGNGEDGVFPWNDSVDFAGYRVSGCGGGGAYSSTRINGSGGAGGGGAGGVYSGAAGVAGTANTGGGGGGGGRPTAGGKGGSGVVFICWGYTH